jgi:hypothetical protein
MSPVLGRVEDHNRRSKADSIPGNIGQVDQRQLCHAPLELTQARVDKILALLRHVIFGILRQISHGHGLFDLRREFVLEFVLQNLNFRKKLFFNMLGHPWSVAVSRVAQTARG